MFLLKKIFHNGVKGTFLTVYLFSHFQLYPLFVFLSIIALFGDLKNNKLVIFCFFFVITLAVLAILFFIILNIRSSLYTLEDFLGRNFLQRYYPPSFRGTRFFYPLLSLFFTIIFLIMWEQVTFQWCVNSNTETILDLKKQVADLIDKGLNQSILDKMNQITVKYDESLQLKGVLKKWLSSPYIAPFIDFFDKRK